MERSQLLIPPIVGVTNKLGFPPHAPYYTVWEQMRGSGKLLYSCRTPVETFVVHAMLFSLDGMGWLLKLTRLLTVVQ